MFAKNFKLKKRLTFIVSIFFLLSCGFSVVQYQRLQETRQAAFEVLVRMLKVHKIYDENGEMQLIRGGSPNDGGYVIAKKALDTADVCLGYGISDDISFEEKFSDTYNKPSFGFDCSIQGIGIKNKLCTFIPQCIGSDAFIYKNQESSAQVATFSQQLSALKLEGKKIFLKMDIEGAEYDAFEDIYKHADLITGIAMELHFKRPEETLKAIRLLAELQKNFLLINVHGNNRAKKFFTTKFSKGDVPKVLELSFINKKLVIKHHIAKEQIVPSPLDMPDNPNKPDVRFEISG